MKSNLFCVLMLVVVGFVACQKDESQIEITASSLSYPSPSVFSAGIAIPNLTPSIPGDGALIYSVSPALPMGLTLNTSTGVISGTPTVITTVSSYTVTAVNSSGSHPFIINIAVSDLGPMLIVKFKFDNNQIRLNNIGQPSSVLPGNAAQSPNFNSISSHYLELAQTATTQLGQGAILYHAPETTTGGSNAIDFSKSRIDAEGDTFLEIPLSSIAAGTYQWVRCSLAYQNYDIAVRTNNVDYTGTLASFVGFNTYVTNYTTAGHRFTENANKLQGYWGFAMSNPVYSKVGQAPPGSTTVPNPLNSTSPIPVGSCVVTGKFLNNLVVTGNETHNVVMTLSLSINKSFEWHEIVEDGKYDPTSGEYVVDMGLRGLIPSFIVQ